jgi:hypothetical protein
MRISLAVVLMMLAACGGKDVKKATDAVSKAQAKQVSSEVAKTVKGNWIDDPASVAGACAVGSAPLSPGMTSLARTGSASAARVELGRQMKTKIQGMVKTYQSQQFSDGKVSAEQDITNINRDIVNMEISGSKIHATKERSGELFSLVCVDPVAMQAALEAMKSMNDTMKTAIKARMSDELDDLDAQIDKLTVE